MENFIEKHKKELDKLIQYFQEKIQKIRTGRATPALVEDILIDYYGTKISLKQIAAILCPGPREILIQPWDKNAIEPIERALLQSDLGTSPIVEQNDIRIKLPPLSEEFRKNLTKRVNEEKEEVRQKIRRWRDEILREVQNLFEAKEISEDEKFILKDRVQEVVDEYNKKVEEISAKKIKEIMEL